MESVEEWREIAGFDGRYEVSSRGRVRSWVRPGDNRGTIDTVPHLLTPTPAREYLKVLLSDGNRKYQLLVAHLVATAFIGPRPKDMQCAHKNGNPTDNRVENLRWSTRVENEADKLAHGTRVYGDRHPQSVLSNEQVVELKEALRNPYRGLGMELARKYGVHKSTISAIKYGRNRAIG